MTRASADTVLADSGLTVVAGVSGIGRTTLLDQVRDLARQRGLTTVSLRLSTADQAIPFYLGSWLASELSRSVKSHSPDGTGSGIAAPSGPAAGAPGSAALGAARVANVILRSVLAHDDLVVLVDDAQWIDAHSTLALEMVIRELPRSGHRFVFGVRTPIDSVRRASDLRTFARLRADGLARLLELRPQATGEVSARIAAAAHARVRALGSPAWDVAKALAVLHPLDDAAAELVGTALSLGPAEVSTGLTTLVDAGMIRRRLAGQWRFTVPLLAEALTAALGPFERRQFAATVVQASWAGTVRADPSFVADQMVRAGGFVDRERASRQLWQSGVAALVSDANAAARWLAAAAELTGDSGLRARARLAHAAACSIARDHRAAGGSAEMVLDKHADDLTPDESQDARLIYVLSLRGLGDVAGLGAVAAGGRADRAGADPVTRATALSALGRFAAARALLASERATWSTSGAAAECGVTIEAGAAALAGDPRLLWTLVDTVPGTPAEPTSPSVRDGVAGYRRREVIAGQVRVLALLGDVSRIDRVLRDQRMAVADLPAPDQVLVDWRLGRWTEVMDRVPLMIAGTERDRSDGDSGLLFALAASIHLARGRPALARTTVESGRAADAPMGHLLDLVEARIERTLGADEDARARVSRGLAHAARSGIVAGTDELWLLNALLAVNRGDAAESTRSVAETAAVARRMGTAYAELQHLLTRVVVDSDADAASTACVVARSLEQPFVLARTLETVVRAEAARPELLREAYDIFGELDALLHRCWVRTLMRSFGVAVPDRAATVIENERLLATLVGDAASNRQIATILHTSENSVEGKLSRLFARTGYRSRVELATAVLSGDYRHR